ncbi:transcriptional regulator [Occultella aeris]|uniref:Helix-turn-helix domain protein n=1 Tax=Occultella aeris TaxID=2761496 RepID=A0A7M4DK92_9MICO|nr:helix-turn-helix domain-containing protein [Occultella aeris]VZO37486.1 Helix-turn-helix domain protein [Occultella aeris]
MDELAHEPRLDAAAMKAFAHPLRLRMFSVLSNGGPATATRLAERLGENTAQTSYHLRQLERHGLVEEDTGLGKGRERWWRAASFSMQRTDDGAGPVQAILRSAIVEDQAATLQTWLSDDSAPQEWVTASLEQSTTAVLTAPELAALNREVQEVIDRHTSAGSGREAALREGSAGLRRIRVYYDGFPLPLD